MVQRSPDVVFGAQPHALQHHQIAGEADGDRRKKDMKRDGKSELNSGQMERVEFEHGPYL